ncbi:MAG: WYL domain-containing protein, partial [Microbacteriaceae bacterium]|nr:WYL domain-containing protein [Microbacteriaceae bacterium]
MRNTSWSPEHDAAEAAASAGAALEPAGSAAAAKIAGNADTAKHNGLKIPQERAKNSLLRVLNLLQLLGSAPETGLNRAEIFDALEQYDLANYASEELRKRAFDVDKAVLAELGLDFRCGSATEAAPQFVRYRIDPLAAQMPDGIFFSAAEAALLRAACMFVADEKAVLRSGLLAKIAALQEKPEESEIAVRANPLADPQILREILPALQGQGVLRFMYAKPGKQATERTVSPQRLLLLDGRLNLLAWDHKRRALRHFLLHRIVSVPVSVAKIKPVVASEQQIAAAGQELEQLRQRQVAVLRDNAGLQRRVQVVDFWAQTGEFLANAEHESVVGPPELVTHLRQVLQRVIAQHSDAPQKFGGLSDVPRFDLSQEVGKAVSSGRPGRPGAANAVDYALSLIALVPALEDASLTAIAHIYDTDIAQICGLVETINMVEPVDTAFARSPGYLFDLDLYQRSQQLDLLERGVFVRPLRFTPDELRLLHQGLDLLAPSLSGELLQAAQKCEQKLDVLGESGAERQGETARQAEKHGQPDCPAGLRNDSATYPAENLRQTIERAVLEKRLLTFIYQKQQVPGRPQSERQTRRVVAQRLRYAGAKWLLEGFCLERQASRAFDLRGISALEVGEIRPDVPDFKRERQRFDKGEVALIAVSRGARQQIAEFEPRYGANVPRTASGKEMPDWLLAQV